MVAFSEGLGGNDIATSQTSLPSATSSSDRGHSSLIAVPRNAVCLQEKPHSLGLFLVPESVSLKRTQSTDIIKPQASRATQQGTGWPCRRSRPPITTGYRSRRGETRGSDPTPHIRTPHVPGPTSEMPMPYTCEGLRHPSHLNVSPALVENNWVRPSSRRFEGFVLRVDG